MIVHPIAVCTSWFNYLRSDFHCHTNIRGYTIYIPILLLITSYSGNAFPPANTYRTPNISCTKEIGNNNTSNIGRSFATNPAIHYKAAIALSNTASSPLWIFSPLTAPNTAPLEDSALAAVDSAAVVSEALSVAALLSEAVVLVALEDDEDSEAVSDELAAALLVLEAAVAIVVAAALSLALLAAALLSAAEAVLAGADETEADSVLCFGTVFVDSRTKNGV